VPTDDADRELLERFVAVTAEAMLGRGWEVDPAGLPDSASIFLGNFRQTVNPEWLATVEFIKESGPVDGVKLRLSGRRRFHRFEVTVGGEIGVRHLPTEQLFREFNVRREATISLDLADVFDERGDELPSMTDVRSVEQASEALVAVVTARAMPFAREHADVDAAIAFISGGGQRHRSPEFEYILIPALLATSGRRAEARAALATYSQRPKSGPRDEEEYGRFAAQLSAWLDNPSALL